MVSGNFRRSFTGKNGYTQLGSVIVFGIGISSARDSEGV